MTLQLLDETEEKMKMSSQDDRLSVKAFPYEKERDRNINKLVL